MTETTLRNPPLVAVIDDEPAFAKSITIVLQSRGYRVSIALSAQEGWEMIKRERPHVVLCDINMPGSDGVDLFTRVRGDRQFAELPFVFLSGLFTPEEAADRSEDARPGTYYLAKPVRGDDLTRMIEKAIATGAPHSGEPG
ncbi:MAG TPA: response regulator [Opitutaceae bacterium]|nr:response regulator [Opitutaceae bacterium]